jgi:adenosylmethionine-8-amino-7-oxononanoate aminotransferase
MSSGSNSAGSFYSSNNIATATAIASLTAMNEIQTMAQHVETKTNYLMSLKEGIENMPVVHQIEVLRILCSKNTQINENKNGVFVNISRLNNDLIQELYDYMKYFINQENHLNEIEQQKQSLTKEFFDK